ncbi:hypothetical protein QYE76_046544 [Lolium multiflorum]|uniref:Uncharacterized protein n=1 Tax=Lolium multiflorum TaxID=4521 RepID=A0AAD8X0S7_LOLMU|nr:hypothetical protein QYE76_046544 [Lolium multiflorum]
MWCWSIWYPFCSCFTGSGCPCTAASTHTSACCYWLSSPFSRWGRPCILGSTLTVDSLFTLSLTAIRSSAECLLALHLQRPSPPASLSRVLTLTLGHWLGLALSAVTPRKFGSLIGFMFLLLPLHRLHPVCLLLPPPPPFSSGIIALVIFVVLDCRVYFDKVFWGHSCSGFLSWRPCPNGVAERKHRHLLEMARAMMIVVSLPPHFWAEAVSIFTYLINLQPSTALQGGIPLERLTGRAPDYSTLRLFGCVAMFFLLHIIRHSSSVCPCSAESLPTFYSFFTYQTPLSSLTTFPTLHTFLSHVTFLAYGGPSLPFSLLPSST